MKKLVLMLLVFVMSSTTAFAASNYWGLDYSFVNYEESGGLDADVGVLSLKFGTYLNEYFAAEARVGFGIDDDTVDVFGVPVEFEVDNFIGVYMRAEMPHDKVRPYAILGVTRGEATASAMGFSVSEDETDLSYGAGVDFVIGEKAGIDVEYMQLIDKSDFEITTINLGFKYRF